MFLRQDHASGIQILPPKRHNLPACRLSSRRAQRYCRRQTSVHRLHYRCYNKYRNTKERVELRGQPVPRMAAERPPIRNKTPTNRIESVEFKVERPVYFYYPASRLKLNLLKLLTWASWPGHFLTRPFFFLLTEPATYSFHKAILVPTFKDVIINRLQAL